MDKRAAHTMYSYIPHMRMSARWRRVFAVWGATALRGAVSAIFKQYTYCGTIVVAAINEYMMMVVARLWMCLLNWAHVRSDVTPTDGMPPDMAWRSSYLKSKPAAGLARLPVAVYSIYSIVSGSAFYQQSIALKLRTGMAAYMRALCARNNKKVYHDAAASIPSTRMHITSNRNLLSVFKQCP